MYYRQDRRLCYKLAQIPEVCASITSCRIQRHQRTMSAVVKLAVPEMVGPKIVSHCID